MTFYPSNPLIFGGCYTLTHCLCYNNCYRGWTDCYLTADGWEWENWKECDGTPDNSYWTSVETDGRDWTSPSFNVMEANDDSVDSHDSKSIVTDRSQHSVDSHDIESDKSVDSLDSRSAASRDSPDHSVDSIHSDDSHDSHDKVPTKGAKTNVYDYSQIRSGGNYNGDSVNAKFAEESKIKSTVHSHDYSQIHSGAN